MRRWPRCSSWCREAAGSRLPSTGALPWCNVTTVTTTAEARALEEEAGLVHRYADLEGVRLHYVEAGEGPLVVLLHGFPEFWYTWRHQIPSLARAGFRVIAPDMRGYNLSGKPEAVRAYGIRTLVEDVAQLIQAVGAERASVVGHDWGAGVAWAFAMLHPELLERLAVLNGPHPERLLRGMLNPIQLAKSWYLFFFQLPWLPGEIARLDNFDLLTKSFREEPIREGAYDRHDLARYVEALNQPGALEAVMKYFRAMFLPSQAFKVQPIDAQVLVIWGRNDKHLGEELAVPSPRFVPHARVEYINEATHWVQHDCPERVSELLIEFLDPRSAPIA